MAGSFVWTLWEVLKLHQLSKMWPNSFLDIKGQDV